MKFASHHRHWFDDAPKEQLDELMGLRLRNILAELGLTGVALKSGVWRRLIWMWTNLVGCSAAPVEFLHGRNKARASSVEHWSHFVAKTILEEGSAIEHGSLHVASIRIHSPGSVVSRGPADVCCIAFPW